MLRQQGASRAWAVAAAMAALTWVSCSGMTECESPVGPSAVVTASAADAAVDEVAQQGTKQVEVCHRNGNGEYSLLRVSPSAVPGHLGHGDPADASMCKCPCFTQADIDAFDWGASCGTKTAVYDCRQEPDLYRLGKFCVGGRSVALVNAYSAYASSGAVTYGCSIFPQGVVHEGLSENQYKVCVAAIAESEASLTYCQ